MIEAKPLTYMVMGFLLWRETSERENSSSRVRDRPGVIIIGTTTPIGR